MWITWSLIIPDKTFWGLGEARAESTEMILLRVLVIEFNIVLFIYAHIATQDYKIHNIL